MKRQHLSHTGIEAFENCPRYFKAARIDKKQTLSSIPMLVGSFIHGWAELYVNRLVENEEQTNLDEGRKLFEGLWPERMRDKQLRHLPEAAHTECAELVELFLESHAIEYAQVVGSEVELAFTYEWEPCEWFDKTRDVFFRAKIDRLDTYQEDGKKVMHVTDYKTGWAIDSPSAIENKRQLKRYIMGLVLNGMKADIYRVTMDYTRHQIQRTVDVPADIVEKEQKYIMSVSNRVEACVKNDDWPATPGAACSWCPAFNDCPAKELAGELVAPDNPAEATKIFQEVILLKKEIENRNALLGTFVDMYGPVRSGGLEYGPFREVKLEWAVPQIVAWAENNSIPFIDKKLVKVNTDGVKRFVAKMEKMAAKGNSNAKAAVSSLPAPKQTGSTKHRSRKVQ